VKGNDEEAGEVLKAKEVIADEKPKEEETKVFDVVEQMPEFPGGQAALLKWISDNIKYPAIAEENGIQGRVVCTFVVERDGSVTDVQVARSIDPSLDKEAVRVLKKMPKWIPGKQNGSAVRVKYTVPVTFRLQ
jgi:protein TonB